MSDRNLSQDIVNWLLEPENPSIRYFTLRDLLERPIDDPEVQEAKLAISNSSITKRIFSKQAAGGYWGNPDTPYKPKYKSSYWTLMLLAYLGLDREDKRVKQAVDYIWQFQQPEGGFAEFADQGAHKEYKQKVKKRKAKGKEPPEEKDFVSDLIHQMTLSCLTGNMTGALLRLGYVDHPRLWQAVSWLTSIQNQDGGWLCPYWKAHIRDTHSCFYGTICPLEALAEIPKDKRSPAIQEAIEKGAEFLLMHRLYRADHHDFKVINKRWLKLSFPWFYGYDILRGLWVLTKLGYRDERMDEALEVLKQKRTFKGVWILESTPYSRMQANLGRKGRPSKWVTLKALWVLKRSAL